MNKLFKKNNIIYCDFDGTITTRDTIDFLLETFADSEWEKIEEEWKAGKIGSRECLLKQINCIPTIDEKTLLDFISTIKIDSGFFEFYDKVINEKIPFYVISDGFDLIIKNVFKNNQLPLPKIYSNILELNSQKLDAFFPMSNANLCLVKAGMCKCSIIEKESEKIIYIGDGRSDFCASRLANSLYAKGSLQKMCDEINRPYIPFKTFHDIINSLKE